MISSNHVINPGIYKSIPFDSLKDITPIAVLATVPLVLVVNPGLPVKSTKELLAHAKAKPGTLNYGSAGNGSTLHLAAELLVSETGIDMKHVPYRGTGPLITDLIGGQVNLAFVSVSQVAPQVKAGTLRALAVSTRQRSAALPEVPTLAEVVPGLTMTSWHGLWAPAATPAAIQQRFNAVMIEASKDPELAKRIRELNSEPLGLTQAEMAAALRRDAEIYSRIVKAKNIRVD